MMTCQELNIPAFGTEKVYVENFFVLHHDGQHLIRSWFERAWFSHTENRGDDFESFIFLWIAFNGWASCVTGEDRDFRIIQILAASPRMNADFKSFIDSAAGRSFKGGLGMLPIFDVKGLGRDGLLRFAMESDRQHIVDEYFARGYSKFEPQCWKRHRDDGPLMPTDWPHVLKAIYKIRCNLFHGMKAAHSEMDRKIVSMAFLILYRFVEIAGYITR